MHDVVADRPALGSRFHRLLLSSGLANLADGIGVVAWPWLASLIPWRSRSSASRKSCPGSSSRFPRA